MNQSTNPSENLENLDQSTHQNYWHECSYCPEDNKLRFSPDWSDPDFDKEKLKAAGYRWASKQDIYVCPRWTPKAEDAALDYVDEIIDEDYSPTERAADRAERFTGYRDKRASEAGALADRYESGPDVFGNQNQSRAERQARKADRIRGNAVSQWRKAEYWQQRTSGVIAHALHRADAGTRRGRILEIEKEIRRIESYYTPAEPRHEIDGEDGRQVWCGGGRGGRWVRVNQLEAIQASYARMIEHLQMRLIYENGMLENEGGKAADVEMIPGGFLGSRQIQKINRSQKTGRVVSVQVWGKDWHGNRSLVTLNVERLGEDVYRNPSGEELAEFKRQQKAKPKAPGLVNPSLADAERLQQLWNKRAENNRYHEPGEVLQMAQKDYTIRTKRSDSWLTLTLFDNGRGTVYKPEINQLIASGAQVIGKIRVGSRIVGTDSIVVLTDKTQKPLALDWEQIEAGAEQEATAAS